jgi:glycosyltransferase involved in cell wall biosynthesis
MTLASYRSSRFRCTGASAISLQRIDEQGASLTTDPNQQPHLETLPICVIIPVYNRAHLLERALRGVWSQRPMLPAEVLVVDDGSDDETAEVARKLGARVISHPENRGLSATRNTGLAATTQPWVALLDSDDEWLPDHLANLWRLRGDHALVAGAALCCGMDPAQDKYHGPATRKPKILASADQLVSPENIIPVSASMVKRDVALEAGGFQAQHGVSEDLDLWLRVLAHHTAICSPEVSIIYHVHGEQMSAELSQMLRGHLAACEAHMKRTGDSGVRFKQLEGVAAFRRLREAQRRGELGKVMHWARYILARPQRVIGSLELMILRYKSARRANALRAAGVGPARRGSKRL